MKLSKLARQLGGIHDGDSDPEILGVSSPAQASTGDIAFVETQAVADAARTSAATAFLCGAEIRVDPQRPTVRVQHPRGVFLQMLQLFERKTTHDPGIHPSAEIGDGCDVHVTASIGPGCVLGQDCTIEAGVRLVAYCVLDDGVRVGENSLILPFTYVGPLTSIGKACRIQAGVTIGSDGFGYIDESDQRHRVPHLGSVVLGDEVDVGAGTTIDRSVVGSTVIGSGTKLDNLVQVGHNTEIGANSLLVAQAGVSGSCSIGEGVTIAGQAGISDHVKIGDGAVVVGQAGVRTDIPPAAIVGGVPALPIRETNQIFALLRTLPDLVSRVDQLENRTAPKPVGDATAVENYVRQVLARHLNTDEESIAEDMLLREQFGADSLAVLGVVQELESTLGVVVPDEDIRDFKTLGHIVRYLETRT